MPILGTLALMATAIGQPQYQAPIEGLYNIDLLPRFRDGIKYGAVTSYDRTGGNDDGFSGTYSFVRKEGDTLVLADLKGPGCITRMHTPTASNDLLEFYLDGSEKPAISMPYSQYFTGQNAPFLKPLVNWAAGGAYSYVPIPYQESCKVVLRASRTQFYDINFVQYPKGTKVAPFLAEGPAGFEQKQINEVWAIGQDKDLSAYSHIIVPHRKELSSSSTKLPFDKILLPGKSVTLLDAKRGGRVVGFKLSPASAFSGNERDTLVRISWDGEKTPAVFMPVGDFFGYAFGRPAMESALLGSTDGMNYCHYPMPFAKSAKIELVSTQTSGAGFPVRGEVILNSRPLEKNEGRFYARWNRENPTVAGVPFTWLKGEGRGHIVGLSVQAQGQESGIPSHFEGDDVTVTDGEMVVHGTGSEDFFNGGWYALPGRWDRTLPLPLSGCLLYDESTGRTGGYRFFMNDAYSFSRSIQQTIEHGGDNNSVISDYVGVAYYYAENAVAPPCSDITSQGRKVVDPTKLIFSVHSNLHLDTFGQDRFTITRDAQQVGSRWVGCLTATAENLGGFASSHIGFRTDFPAAGVYKVTGHFIKGPDSAIVRLSTGAVALGPDVDLYSSAFSEEASIYLGEFTAKKGENAMFLHFLGRNSAASAAKMHLVFLKAELVKRP